VPGLHTGQGLNASGAPAGNFSYTWKMIKRIARKSKIPPAGLIGLALLAVVLPPYASKGFAIQKILHINAFILTHSIRGNFKWVFPVFNSLTLLVFICALLVRGKASRVLSVYLFILYMIISFLQNISISEQFGVAVYTTTMLISMITALAWLQEWILHENIFSKRIRATRMPWLVPPAVLALWYPINPANNLPDFRLGYFLSSGSSLTFCVVTVVALSIMLAYYPDINFFLLMTTSVFGLLVGIGNIWLEIFFLPGLFWVGLFHIPLILLSLVGLFASWKHRTKVG
jgi:hypothetical protein